MARKPPSIEDWGWFREKAERDRQTMGTGVSILTIVGLVLFATLVVAAVVVLVGLSTLPSDLIGPGDVDTPAPESTSQIETVWQGLPRDQRAALCWDDRPATVIFDPSYVSPAFAALRGRVGADVKDGEIDFFLDRACRQTVHTFLASDIRPGWWISIMPGWGGAAAVGCNPFAPPDSNQFPPSSYQACQVEAVERLGDSVRVTYANGATQDFPASGAVARI